MRITPLLTICMCLIAATAVWGQAPSTSTKPGVLGYLDPRTGAFRPIPQLAAEDADVAAAPSTIGGTITLTITVTLKTTAITAVTCTAEVTVLDNPAVSPTTFGESNTVAASGSPKTCKLTIPYSWILATQSTDSMSIDYSVFGAVGTTGLPQRTATRVPLVTMKVPANGATTALTAAVTL